MHKLAQPNIRSIDWSTTSEMMRISTTDYRKIYYKNFTESDCDGEQDDLWTTNTCILNWSSMGLFSPNPESVINAFRYKNLWVVLEQKSIKIYEWPCMVPN